jgi:hypothetical protein
MELYGPKIIGGEVRGVIVCREIGWGRRHPARFMFYGIVFREVIVGTHG